MKIKCGLCGEEIVIEEGLSDGQHIRCPWCDGIFEFHMPTRIELPTGARCKQPETSAPKEADSDAVPELPAFKRNPKLRLIRPGTGVVDSNGGRTNSLVEQVEARAKAEARRKLKQKLKRAVSNIISILLLAALAVIGFKAYRSWKGGSSVLNERLKTDESKPMLQEVAEQKEGTPKSEPDRQVETKQQNDKEPDPYKTAFSAVQAKFVGCPVSYWGKLAREERPGMTVRTFHLFIPRKSGGGEYYELQSGLSNAVTMTQVTGSPFSPKSQYDDYVKLLTAKKGFLLRDGVAYLITPPGTQKTFQAPTRKGDSFDPAAAVFGEAYETAKGMDISHLRFEVSFSMNEKDESQKIATVSFGQTVSYELFAKAAKHIAEVNKRKSAPSRLKVKTFQQTLVLYDGAHVSRSLKGVTKVPRKRPDSRNYKEWRDWPSLYDQALRQESEARRSAEEAERMRKEWNAKVNAPATESEIRNVLFAGTVTVNRL